MPPPTGSIRMRPFSPDPLLVTRSEPSESVMRLSGSVPTATWRPAGRIRHPEGSTVVPSGCGPGITRVTTKARPARAGKASRASRARLSMGRNMAAPMSCGSPLAQRRRCQLAAPLVFEATQSSNIRHGTTNGKMPYAVSLTDWEGEWYLPRAAFQARLVPALDDLLERLQADPSYRSFLLDGQTVLVADYLSACPEQEAEIRTLVKSGRLQIGPWYVLADELIPSGEALVRNLLLGAADAERLGGRLDVLYSPDAFGHPAVWPTLAREFGIRAGVVWRG